MVRTKLTARKQYEKTRNLPVWLLNKDYGRKKIRPFKVKVTLPEQKPAKHQEVIKTINVRQKSKYFSGRNKRVF